MKVVKTITPADVVPERYRASCETCAWVSLRSRFAETAETLAETHVRATNHRVNIEEDEL